ncbi:hypothetical protein TIFTF001_009671 [Ficus carica]|uniref:Reverse transcriptase zinc-binding domain-containing protein n=1 Tax=Ficus carica TaxID=3494 RepID=A0AA88CZ56_FICCA|nr:hypothetical protein TIFTF001_009671 [Ficus carica]
MPIGGEYLMVVDLMLEGSRVWDKDKIENSLWLVDQELIRGISLGNGDGGDKWAWHFDSKGLYKMWSLLIPPKVWLFVWCAFHEILSTMVSLSYRGIDCDAVCPRCKDKMESISHAILDCPMSQAVWRFSRFWTVIENRRDFLFANFLRIVKSKILMEDFALVCWLAWKLWCERNKALNQVSIQFQAVGPDVWLPPQPGYFKLNVDASVSPESDHIGIALREGLMIAKELESVSLVVETNAINVVSAVSDNQEFFVECPIMEDVKQLLVQLRSIGVYHIRRSANYVAHL